MRFTLCFLLTVNLCLAQSSPDFTIRFNQQAFVQIRYRQNPRPMPITVGTFNILPAYQNPKVLDTLRQKEGQQTYAVEVRTPQQGYFNVGPIHYDLYLIPKDTIKLSIDFENDTLWHDRKLTFTASLAAYQEYYRQRNLALPDFGFKRAMAASNAPSLTAYRFTMDSLYRQERTFFDTYIRQHQLPDWFVEDITNQVVYGDAGLRENAVFYRRFMNKGKEEHIPVDYFDYQKRAPIRNDKAFRLTQYSAYLDSHLFLKSGRKIGEDLGKNWLTDTWAQAATVLSTKILPYYKALTLSVSANLDPAEAVQLINKHAPTFQDKALIAAIRTDAQAKINMLKSGDMAPNFHLSDPLDSLVSLSSFRGNVVLLCFWFPGCKPCVAEFPHENALVEKFKDKPVRIVGIGTTNGREAWLVAIQKHQLKMVHLYANERWQKTLETKYSIVGYPRYVLIDQQGRIVNNYAPRPSQNVAAEIEKLLR